MAELKSMELTEDERERYDRQIRVWGMEAQQRMQNSNILVVGATGLASEICKNLVLAGIGNLTILDAEKVQKKDLGAQFFLRIEDLGKNRAECLASRVQKLNTNVKIVAVTKTAEELDIINESRKFFQSFDVVCVTARSLARQIQINEHCRAASKMFYSAEVFGRAGFFFSDLCEHEYIKTGKGETGEEKKEKLKTSFESLVCCLSTPWSTCKGIYRRRLKLPFQVFLAVQVLYIFEFRHSRFPNVASDKDLQALYSIRDGELNKQGLEISDLSDDILTKIASGAGVDISSTCAVLGGLLGQEILKAISGADEPLQNFFVYECYVIGGGVVQNITTREKKKKKPVNAQELDDSDEEKEIDVVEL